MFNKSVVQLEIPKGAFILNLSHFERGPDSALQRIPQQTAGIYSWFKSYIYPENEDDFYDALIRDLEAAKFQSRSGSIKPYYNVEITSKGWLSESKALSLKTALKNAEFKKGLLDAFSCSTLLQSPLYVGKSVDLRGRIGQHLQAESDLRVRLANSGINIDTASVLIMPNTDTDADTDTDKQEIASNTESMPVNDPQFELLYEEVFSRLFNPRFTIRLG